jgi:hypothetical protein
MHIEEQAKLDQLPETMQFFELERKNQRTEPQQHDRNRQNLL